MRRKPEGPLPARLALEAPSAWATDAELDRLADAVAAWPDPDAKATIADLSDDLAEIILDSIIGPEGPDDVDTLEVGIRYAFAGLVTRRRSAAIREWRANRENPR